LSVRDPTLPLNFSVLSHRSICPLARERDAQPPPFLTHLVLQGGPRLISKDMLNLSRWRTNETALDLLY
jgi:hypothetical protein